MNGRILPLWLCVAAVFACALSRGAEPTRRIDVSQKLASGRAGFQLQPPDRTGIAFTNFLALQRHLTNNILLDGSGVACGDVDGDGLVDVYLARLDGPNALYRNLGDWKFQDIATQAGVACADLDSTGVVLADLDGDIDLDLIVNSMGGGTHVFNNDGMARFSPSPQNPLNGQYGGTSLALADIDGNGTLDLYIANYRTVSLRDQPNTKFNVRMIKGQPQVTSINGRPLTDPEYTNRFTFHIGMKNGTATFTPEENGEPDGLYLNDGKGRFTLAPFTGGAFIDESGAPLREPPFDWGLSVVMRDLNGDGAPDIYVCNDFKAPDRIWINNGKGRFQAIAPHAILHTSLFSMGIDVADINRDGAMDIFVLDMLSRDHQRRMTQRGDAGGEMPGAGDAMSRAQSGRNTLLLARGDGTYAEIAHFSGVQATEWSWTPVFLDVDLDGFEDLLVANGFERDGMNVDVAAEIKARKTAQKMTSVEQLSLRARYPRLATPNVALRNLGNGRFQDASSAWGFDLAGVSQGMALADLDNDGDTDVVINNFNGPAFVLENTAPAPRIGVRLKGASPNTRGIGARITMRGGKVLQTQEVISGGRYQSSDDPMRVFAAEGGKPFSIEVIWRTGRRTVVSNALPNSIYEIDEAASHPFHAGGVAERRTALFEDVSSQLNHRHSDEPFNDFERQPLLPRKLSEPGPGVSWCDVDGDGRDDLFVSGGRGGALELFRNRTNGGFLRVTNAFAGVPLQREHTALVGVLDARGEFNLFTAAASYDELAPGGASVQRYVGKSTEEVGASRPWSVGPLAMADVDGNGELDLFVGGRAIPGQFPEFASSVLFLQKSGVFTADTANSAALTNAGLVSGAMFSDINSDGHADLVLACDWGPVRVLTNHHGKLSDATVALGLDKYRGWWTAVASIDANADGRMDIVAANWGENTRFESVRSHPLRLYYGDFDGNGIVEAIESYFDPATSRYVPARQLDAVTRGMPWLQARFPTWESFSRAGVNDLLGEFAQASRFLEVNWPATTVFVNRGDSFGAARLPDEAQWSPVFGLAVADFDMDGSEDVILAQNFFGVTADTSRYDAGRGLLLRGDGSGGFSAVAGDISGIAAYGEQRAAAVGDFDQDGRPDVAMTQYLGETKLYRNRGGTPGVRVRLAGPPGNRTAVGAQLQMGEGPKWGAAREVQAGSGYSSQHSSVLVLARTGSQVRVRWPGGKVTVSPLRPEWREVTIGIDGNTKGTP